jgi:gluconokinase
MIVVLMGVCGSGKTAVGQALAKDLAWPFFDGDDFHPPENVAKMAAGTPLEDADRWPWLDRLAAEMAAVNARGGNAVLACSALRNAYRERLSRAGDVRFVHLSGDYDTIAARLAQRSHRYMPPTLLASQFAALEVPADAIVVDVREGIPAQIAKIRAALNLSPSVGPASAGRFHPAPDTPPEVGPTNCHSPEGGPTISRNP